MSDVERIQYYRDEAARLRGLAKAAMTEDVRRDYEKIASLYAGLADDIEKRGEPLGLGQGSPAGRRDAAGPG
jgi:hypothetical protein